MAYLNTAPDLALCIFTFTLFKTAVLVMLFKILSLVNYGSRYNLSWSYTDTVIKRTGMLSP